MKESAAAWFKRMEDGDEAALKNWRVWRELSVKKYAEEYERLNVKFDVYNGESMVPKEKIDYAINRLEEMGLVSDKEGAKIIDLEKYKLGSAVVRKKGACLSFLLSSLSLSSSIRSQTARPSTSPATSAAPSLVTRSTLLTR